MGLGDNVLQTIQGQNYKLQLNLLYTQNGSIKNSKCRLFDVQRKSQAIEAFITVGIIGLILLKSFSV